MNFTYVFSYLKMELKKMISCMPMILLGVLIFSMLIGGTCISATAVKKITNKEEEPIKVALVQNTEDKYTTIAISAVEELDVIKDTIKFERMSKDEAVNLLKQNKLFVVFVFPDDYAKSLYYGEESCIEVIINKQTTSLYSYMVKPLTEIATNYIVQSERGIYTIKDYYNEKDLDGRRDAEDELNLDYFRLLLNRNSIFLNKELSNTYKQSSNSYYFCIGIIILIFMSMLTYAKALRSESISLYKRIDAFLVKSYLQVITKYVSCIIITLIPYSLVLITSIIITNIKDFGITISLKEFILLFPIVLPAVALSLLLYELSENTAGAMLSYFFIFVVLGFISGLFYPENYLPVFFNKIADFTVTKAVLKYSLAVFFEDSFIKYLLIILFHTTILLLITIFARIRRLRKS